MWKTFLYRLALKKHMTKHVEPGKCDKLFSMEDCYKAVVSALKVGYMELDTAAAFDNERSCVGPVKNGEPKCVPELRESLKMTGVKMVDLWLIDWPGPEGHLNCPPVKMGMDRPKVEIETNKEKMAPMDWSPDMKMGKFQKSDSADTCAGKFPLTSMGG